MRIIYEPRGRALEYAPLAVSLYRGCSHGCIYCFAPDSTKTKREDFLNPHARKDALKLLARDCEDLVRAGDNREILMSFTTDPYQPLDEELNLTRSAIQILIDYARHFTILTKAGDFSERDFDLMAEHKDLCRYGASLTIAPGDRKQHESWEPKTAICRTHALWRAHKLGIPTWVSLEPVIYPEHALWFIEVSHDYVDEYRIGKFNHNRALCDFMTSIGYQYPTDDQWREFVQRAEALLRHHHCHYVFKKDLQPYLRKEVGA